MREQAQGIGGRLGPVTRWRRALPLALAGALLTHAASVRALQPLEAFQRAARKENHAIRESSQVAEQRSSEASVELGRLLPSLNVTGTYTRNQVEVSVARPAGNGQTETAVIAPLDQFDATLALRVPVIDVGAWYRLSAARANEDAAHHRAEATVSEEEAEVARHYYAYVGSSWLLEATDKALAAATENLSVVEKRREVERALELDVLRARAEVERARRTSAEVAMQLRSARRSLVTASGLEPESGVPPLDVGSPDSATRGDVRLLAAGSVGVRAAEAEAVAAERSRKGAWAAFAPVVSASVTERLTNATGFAGRSALFAAQVTASWALDYTTFAQARSRGAAAAAARIRAERAAAMQADLIADALDRIEVQGVRARAASVESDAATQAVALWRERLAAGTATVLEVVQAERDALAASVGRIQAAADLAYARALYAARTRGPQR